jgi:serine O-acetyltransferase
MIDSYQKYKYFLECDRVALRIIQPKTFSDKVKKIIFPNQIYYFQRLLRKMEYYHNCKPGGITGKLYKVFLTRRFNRCSIRLGFSIPVNTFGPGLSIAHYGTIVVNSGARVGANCRIHVGVNIGTEAGEAASAPELGNNIYIGPGAKLFGSIKIADGCVIGANTVVNKSVNEKNSVLVGMPARVIKTTDSFDYLIGATYLVDRNITPSTIAGKKPSELKQYYFSE